VLLCWAILVVAWRLVVAARRWPFAPALASALIGFLLVGLFDSLLDVPRVAFVFYFLLFLVLLLPVNPAVERQDPTINH